jgi:hypothetical protein
MKWLETNSSAKVSYPYSTPNWSCWAPVLLKLEMKREVRMKIVHTFVAKTGY